MASGCHSSFTCENLTGAKQNMAQWHPIGKMIRSLGTVPFNCAMKGTNCYDCGGYSYTERAQDWNIPAEWTVAKERYGTDGTYRSLASCTYLPKKRMVLLYYHF
jgi:hypothetical protein